MSVHHPTTYKTGDIVRVAPGNHVFAGQVGIVSRADRVSLTAKAADPRGFYDRRTQEWRPELFLLNSWAEPVTD